MKMSSLEVLNRENRKAPRPYIIGMLDLILLQGWTFALQVLEKRNQ